MKNEIIVGYVALLKENNKPLKTGGSGYFTTSKSSKLYKKPGSAKSAIKNAFKNIDDYYICPAYIKIESTNNEGN